VTEVWIHCTPRISDSPCLMTSKNRNTIYSEPKPKWMIASGCVKETEELLKINIIVVEAGGSEWW